MTPKTYWNLVQSLKTDSAISSGPALGIDSETWYEYFKKLNSVNISLMTDLQILINFYSTKIKLEHLLFLMQL